MGTRDFFVALRGGGWGLTSTPSPQRHGSFPRGWEWRGLDPQEELYPLPRRSLSLFQRIRHQNAPRESSIFKRREWELGRPKRQRWSASHTCLRSRSAGRPKVRYLGAVFSFKSALGIFRAKNPVFLTEIRCFGLEILFAPDGTLSVGDPSHPATSDGHGSKDYFQPLF
jgi:hypothetical protein